MLKNNWLSILISVIVLIGGGIVAKKIFDALAKVQDRLETVEKIVLPPQAEVQEKAYVLPVGTSYVLGKPDAKASIVVFSNFQCGYCARADAALRKALEDPELKETANLVFKHFPFDRMEMARPASKAALAAGEQGKFWEMAETIFAHQDGLSHESIQQLATKLGLDMQKFNTDLKNNNEKYDELINADIKLGAEDAHLKGTPWIVIGGWLYEGDSLDAAEIKKFIKEKKL